MPKDLLSLDNFFFVLLHFAVIQYRIPTWLSWCRCPPWWQPQIRNKMPYLPHRTRLEVGGDSNLSDLACFVWYTVRAVAEHASVLLFVSFPWSVTQRR